jgi:uncharacterized protein YrrD
MRASTLRGKPVVIGDRSEHLGTVSDVLIDLIGTRVVGLLLDGGTFGRSTLLPFAALDALGGPEIVATSGLATGEAERHQGGENPAVRLQLLKHHPVVERDGRPVGTLEDVWIDDVTGTVEAYLVAVRSLGGIRVHHSALVHAHAVTVGPEALVVPHDVAVALGRRRK